jgi:HD-GYP domain-containing protein (c-di-GMP phosphodiesterase class II)
MELALRVATLSVDLGRRLDLASAELSDIYYLALVQHIGCTSDSLEFAAFSGGDDNAFRSHAMLFPAMSGGELLRTMIRYLGEGRGLGERARLLAGMIAHADEQAGKVVVAHCEAGGRLAERLGLSPGVRAGLLQEQERWDGRGRPAGLAGKELCVARRVVLVAHDALVLSQAGDDVLVTLRARRGHAYDPAVVDALVEAGGPPAVEPGADLWAGALDAEPAPVATISQSGIDRVALACADFTDLKSPYLLGHSTRVAQLASDGAEVLGIAPTEVDAVRRSALLHDLGRVGTS